MDLLLRFVDEPKGLTEERLRELLHEKELLGSLGEELALAFESERLRVAGHLVEAHCIKRISKLRVNAGYDIESFDGHSPTGNFDRFIEVKASRGTALQFYWTENEMKVAQELGDRYWIYFFGGVDQVNGIASVLPMLFQDPMQSIMSNSDIAKCSQGMFVQAKKEGIKQ